jgi:exosortase
LTQTTQATSPVRAVPASASSEPRPVWLLWVGLGLMLLCGVVTKDAWADIWLLAMKDEQSSHVLAVPLAVAVLVLARRRRLATVNLAPHGIGCALIAVGLVAWVWGYHTEVQVAWHGGAVLAVVGSFLSCMGIDVAKKFLPALLVLAFLVPTPMTVRNQITMPLQQIAATATFEVCQVLNMGVTQAGQTLRINGQDVNVAEACAGMKMVFTLFLACFMSAYSLPLREPVRWGILLLAPVVAILANIARLVPTIWAYGKFSPEAADDIHVVLGWVMVIAAFFALDGLTKFLDWLSLPIFKPGRGAA